MRQCRIHHAKSTNFYIHVNSQPVIEHSDGLGFAPYSLKYEGLEDDWKSCSVDRATNRWNEVKDFNWFKKQHSPHWIEIPENDRLSNVEPIEEDEEEL